MNENKTPCESCKETPAQVPFYAFESVQWRMAFALFRRDLILSVYKRF